MPCLFDDLLISTGADAWLFPSIAYFKVPSLATCSDTGGVSKKLVFTTSHPLPFPWFVTVAYPPRSMQSILLINIAITYLDIIMINDMKRSDALARPLYDRHDVRNLQASRAQTAM